MPAPDAGAGYRLVQIWVTDVRRLWTVAGGVYASKPRPALIVRDDLFAVTTSLTIAPLTTHLTEAPLLRIRLAVSELSGLDRDSDIMIDNLTTIRRSNVHSRMGRLTAAQLVEVERTLMTFLGLAR